MEKPAFMRAAGEIIGLLEETDICGEQVSRLKSLCRRLENKEFIISVFGQFKRGKSTFINSALGEKILPVGIVPVTSVVTQIKYGRKGAVIFSGDGYRSVALDELDDYINERYNPDNVKKVDSVQINYPNKMLSSGITIVDTPGVGSMHKRNSEAAYGFVKSSDAVIFMLSVDSPINEIERDFLSEIKEYASKIYFAVNKKDIVTPGELEEYTAYCRRYLGEITGAGDIKVYTICAKDEKDEGLASLLSDILKDIKTHGEEMLVDSLRIKSQDISQEALGKVELFISALSMPMNKLEEAAEALGEKLGKLESISKETSYLIDQRTDELMENIRGAFGDEKRRIIEEASARIKEVCGEEPSLKPRLLEEKIGGMLEGFLSARLSELNEKGTAMLKEGYEKAANLFGESLANIHGFLSAAIKELFGVEYRFEEEAYTLSDASDFYININRTDSPFFFETNRTARLLPKGVANKIIMQRVSERMAEDVSRNVTNILSDYSYKLRESKRAFNARFVSKAEELKNGFKTFTEKILSERGSAGSRYGDKIVRLEDIKAKLIKNIDVLKS